MGDSANSPPPLQMPQLSPQPPPLLDIAKIRSKCLSQREKHAKDFLLQEIDACTRESLERYAGAPADENLQRAFDLAIEKVRNVSVTLAHKFQPVVKQQLAHQQNAILDATFAKTRFREVPLATKVSFYKRCFFQLFDDDRCVSFPTPRSLLSHHVEVCHVLESAQRSPAAAGHHGHLLSGQVHPCGKHYARGRAQHDKRGVFQQLLPLHCGCRVCRDHCLSCRQRCSHLIRRRFCPRPRQLSAAQASPPLPPNVWQDKIKRLEDGCCCCGCDCHGNHC